MLKLSKNNNNEDLKIKLKKNRETREPFWKHKAIHLYQNNIVSFRQNNVFHFKLSEMMCFTLKKKHKMMSFYAWV
jgi:hypothetical protein